MMMGSLDIKSLRLQHFAVTGGDLNTPYHMTAANDVITGDIFVKQIQVVVEAGAAGNVLEITATGGSTVFKHVVGAAQETAPPVRIFKSFSYLKAATWEAATADIFIYHGSPADDVVTDLNAYRRRSTL